MKRLLTVMFLRLYALNLGRGSRNSPEDACNDSVMQFGMVLVPPVYTVLLSVVSLTGRENLSRFVDSKPAMIGGVLAMGLPLFYWINRSFGSFSHSPELAEPYMASRTRFATGVGFVLIPLIWFVVTGLALDLYVHHGNLT